MFYFSKNETSTNALLENDNNYEIIVNKLGEAITRNLFFDSTPQLINYLKELDQKVLLLILNNLKSEKIINFLKIICDFQITDYKATEILIEIDNHLNNDCSLENAFKIKENYVKEILYNRPHFSFSDKVKAINNAAKTSDCTNILKYGNLFINVDKNGDIIETTNNTGSESRALGLFTEDMQFLSEYKIQFQNITQISQEKEYNGYCCKYLKTFDKNVIVEQTRVINGAFFEKIKITNNSNEKIISNILINPSFLDIFEVRGKLFQNKKELNFKFNQNNDLYINTQMQSGNIYGLNITFETTNKILPDIIFNKIIYNLEVRPYDEIEISIKIQPTLNHSPLINSRTDLTSPKSLKDALLEIENKLQADFSNIKTNKPYKNAPKTLQQSIIDLTMLKNFLTIKDKTYCYIGAGLPRYSALFGRDSIITALQTLKFNNSIAKDTLELLAHFQGKAFEDRYQKEIEDISNTNWSIAVKNSTIKGLKQYHEEKEEDEGKILHELRTGELALTGEIPHSPYYGTVDATPLWLILLCEYYENSNDKAFIQKLLPNAQKALSWIKRNTINGYLRFKCSKTSKVKIQNQGWKDAGDSIKHCISDEGTLCNPNYPIALAEVQSYVYKAYYLMAKLYNKLGYSYEANLLEKDATQLKINFNKDFWIDDLNFYSMALDANNIPIKNITSNIGHCLTMNIIEDDKKTIIEEKIMSENMFTGWGIRTLCSNHPAYDPLSYHNGSVWVHDTAFIAMGLSKSNKEKLTAALFEAANMFEFNRLPELFAGFRRNENDIYIQNYPEACSPQAWASASALWLIS